MTNLIALRTIEEFNTGYKPGYSPLTPIFTGGNAQQYAVEVGAINFKRLEAIGDLRTKMYGPKDTTRHMIHAKEGSKTYNKYYFGARYQQSALQSQRGYEDVVGQVLDENWKLADDLLFKGEGTANNNVKNNALFFSGDANHVTNSSVEIAAASTGYHLPGMYALVSSLLQTADEIDGRKLVLVYGSTLIGKYNSLFTSTDRPFSEVMASGFPDVDFVKVPAAVDITGNGFIVVNLDQIKTHWSQLPEVSGQGVNEENEYAWTNFRLGSIMIEVLALGAVTRQPVTFA